MAHNCTEGVKSQIKILLGIGLLGQGYGSGGHMLQVLALRKIVSQCSSRTSVVVVLLFLAAFRIGWTEDMDYRQRIAAVYARYCPEKLGNVDSILAKYAGHEDEVIALLVEKYGPEPQSAISDPPERSEEAPTYHSNERRADGGRQLFDSQRPLSSPDGIAVSPTDPLSDDVLERALQARKQRFDKDMVVLGVRKTNEDQAKLECAVVEARSTLQHLETDFAQLQASIAAMQKQHQISDEKRRSEQRKAAQQLVAAKLRLLEESSNCDPRFVAATDLQRTQAECEGTRVQLETLLAQRKQYEQMFRSHLAAYPSSAIRNELRCMDAALLARLDVI